MATNNVPDISNLKACVEDSRQATIDQNTGPADPTNYSDLRDRLKKAKKSLPPLYEQAVRKPYANTIKNLGASDFSSILLQLPDTAGPLMMDIAHAILQNAEGYAETATDAFQEIVSDLYQCFVSASARRGVKPPDLGIIPPLVKWGAPANGPYTWPGDATQVFDVATAIVSLPPAIRQRGILAWGTLGHETAGHDVLHADDGLLSEISSTLRDELNDVNTPDPLPKFWHQWADETASDVLGLLHLGPAAGIALIGYFRAIRAASPGGKPKLSNTSGASSVHPTDILRAYLSAASVRRMSFSGAAAWADVLTAEADRDLGTIRLGGVKIDPVEAKASVEIVSETLMNHPFAALEDTSLSEIKTWNDTDEEIIRDIQTVLTSTQPLSADYAHGIYAGHAVSAAILAALQEGAEIDMVFGRMIQILKEMHDGNTMWGPLFVTPLATVRRHRILS